MSEFIEINILKEDCFVCFDSQESEYITLQCCNKHNIHKKCLFKTFLNYIKCPKELNIENSTISCPLCRQDIYIKDYFILDECITIFTEYNDIYKRKFMKKFNLIIAYNFIDSNHVLSIDETTSTMIVPAKTTYKKYIFILIIFILIVIVIIGLKFIYTRTLI
jgi:hypothetical protein